MLRLENEIELWSSSWTLTDGRPKKQNKYGQNLYCHITTFTQTCVKGGHRTRLLGGGGGGGWQRWGCLCFQLVKYQTMVGGECTRLPPIHFKSAKFCFSCLCSWINDRQLCSSKWDGGRDALPLILFLLLFLGWGVESGSWWKDWICN